MKTLYGTLGRLTLAALTALPIFAQTAAVSTTQPTAPSAEVTPSPTTAASKASDFSLSTQLIPTQGLSGSFSTAYVSNTILAPGRQRNDGHSVESNLFLTLRQPLVAGIKPYVNLWGMAPFDEPGENKGSANNSGGEFDWRVGTQLPTVDIGGQDFTFSVEGGRYMYPFATNDQSYFVGAKVATNLPGDINASFTYRRDTDYEVNRYVLGLGKNFQLTDKDTIGLSGSLGYFEGDAAHWVVRGGPTYTRRLTENLSAFVGGEVVHSEPFGTVGAMTAGLRISW